MASGFEIFANPVPDQLTKSSSVLTVSKSNSISLISPATGSFVVNVAFTPLTGLPLAWYIWLSITPNQYAVVNPKLLVGSIVIALLDSLIEAVKGTSVPFISP